MIPISPTAWGELQDKNSAAHIPPEEFRSLVTFLQKYSPETNKAIQAGSLLAQTELNLSNLQLSVLPNSLRHLANLTRLNMTYMHQVEALPDSIGQLTELREFRINNMYQLKIFPKWMVQLTKLIKLNLQLDGLENLPKEIGQLTELTVLDISFNSLNKLPDLPNTLTNLTTLDVSANLLESLPSSVSQLTNLTHFDVRDNQLTILPNEIGGLASLTELHLGNNQLTILPNEIGGLVSLTELHLGNNQLTILPDEIGALTSLMTLSVHSNQLTALPETIRNLTRLTKLYLGSNQLEALPPSIGELTNLTNLEVHNNQLTAIPPFIGDLGQLSDLYIYENPSLSTLPLSLGECCNLTYFNIKGTKINSSDYDQIIAVCQKMRDLKSADKLPHKIDLWRQFAAISEKWIDPKFTRKQKGSLYEWLLRLEKAKDFEKDQGNLAKTVCDILKTIHEDGEFRKIFFNLIASDLTSCGDRAAMSLNLVYTEWKLYALRADTPLVDRLKFLVGYCRTSILRNIVLAKYPGPENTEKVLYTEGELRKRLNLVTAVKFMHHREIGAIPSDKIEALAQEIQAIPPAKLIVNLDYWKRYLKKHHTSEFFRIVSRTQAALGGLLKRSECGEITDGEYREQEKGLQSQEENALLELTKKIIDEIQTI